MQIFVESGVPPTSPAFGRNQNFKSAGEPFTVLPRAASRPVVDDGYLFRSHSLMKPLQGLCFLALAVIATGAFLTGMPINGHAKMAWPRLVPVVNDGPTPPVAVKGHK
jgi:hypothetical protein